jgi:hypothetical protein
MAGLNVAVSIVFEVIEPEEIFAGLGLPIDDVARKIFMHYAGEAFEEGGEAGLKTFIRNQFGDHADGVINKIDDLVGAFCSFSSDTVVMTEDGPKPISKVAPWDKVLAYDEETGEIGYYPVTAVWQHVDSVIVTLTIDGEEIETTPEHPFYTASDEWLAAAELQVGDEIRTAAWETGIVEAIHITVDPQPMYNFTVATAHTYFVGDGQWLVHNDCWDIAYGHAWDDHAEEFAKIGITDQYDFANYIDEILTGDQYNYKRNLSNGRTAYWRLDKDGLGTVVITDPNHLDTGTAFRPTEGIEYFWGLD